MKRAIVLLILLSGCASVPVNPTICLYYSDKRFDEGTVIEVSLDGARHFKFKDPTKGDNGYRWIKDDGTETVRLARCPSGATASPFDASNGGRDFFPTPTP